MRCQGNLAMQTKHKGIVVFIVLILLVLSSALAPSPYLRAQSNPCDHHKAAKSADCNDDGQVGDQDEGQVDNADDAHVGNQAESQLDNTDDGQVGNQDEGQVDNADHAQVGNQDNQNNAYQKHGQQGDKGDQQGENNN